MMDEHVPGRVSGRHTWLTHGAVRGEIIQNKNAATMASLDFDLVFCMRPENISL